MGKFLFLWGSYVQMPETIPVASPLKDRLLGIPKFEWYSRTQTMSVAFGPWANSGDWLFSPIPPAQPK